MRLQRKQDLIPALRQVVDGRTLNDELAIYRLQALGLVRRTTVTRWCRAAISTASISASASAAMADAFMFVAGGAVQAGGGIYLERVRTATCSATVSPETSPTS